MAVKCSAITRGGSRCRSPVLPGSTYCFVHDPMQAEARREAARKGGRNRANKVRAAKAMPEAMEHDDVLGVIGLALRGVLDGTVEPGVGNAVANLSRAYVAVAEAGALQVIEERLAVLERIAEGQMA